MKWRFGIIGGDRRQAELARMLAQDGHVVTTYGLDSGENVLKGRLEQALKADVVILPLPLCTKPGRIVCGNFSAGSAGRTGCGESGTGNSNAQ